MMDYKTHILIVDDEEDLCEILQFNLESQGYEVTTTSSAEEALEKNLEDFDLFILDVMMGGISGFKLAEKIRKEFNLKTPIIFLTARGTENDLLTGFNLGADDYISKPFSINEVSARVKAVARRMVSHEIQESADSGDNDITINSAKKTVTVKGEEIILTKKEFEILEFLLNNQNRIFTRDEIMFRVWTDEVIVSKRTIDVNIARLRKKLGDSGNSIKNKAGFGYYFSSNTN